MIQVEIDGTKYNFNAFSISVGICRYNGGGIMQLPNAIPDDGLLDITIIKIWLRFSAFIVTQSLQRTICQASKSINLYSKEGYHTKQKAWFYDGSRW